MYTCKCFIHALQVISIKYQSATNIRQGWYQLSHLASCCLSNILKQKSTNCIQLIWHENMRMNDFFFISKIIFIYINWYINKNPNKQNQNRYFAENHRVLFFPYFPRKWTVVHSRAHYVYTHSKIKPIFKQLLCHCLFNYQVYCMFDFSEIIFIYEGLV